MKDGKCEKERSCRFKGVLQHGVGDSVWSDDSGRKKIGGHCRTGDEKRAERETRLLRTGARWRSEK